MQRQSMLLWVTLSITLILQTTTTVLAEDKPRVEAFPIIQDDPTHPETPQQILQINVQNYESFPVFCPIIKIYAGIEVGGRIIANYPVVIIDLSLDAKQELTGRDESQQLRKHLSAYPNWQISTGHLETLQVNCHPQYVNNIKEEDKDTGSSKGKYPGGTICQFGGRVGGVVFTNNSLYIIDVKLWHPDNQQIYTSSAVPGNSSKNFGINVGDDWGVQLGSSRIKCIGAVANLVNNTFTINNLTFYQD